MLSLQVVEFHPDSTIIETTKTPEQLNLQPRDISIFATNKLGVQAQRATITPRNGAVLFRTEIAKAIIYKDRAVLFHSRSALVLLHMLSLFLCRFQIQRAMLSLHPSQACAVLGQCLLHVHCTSYIPLCTLYIDQSGEGPHGSCKRLTATDCEACRLIATRVNYGRLAE